MAANPDKARPQADPSVVAELSTAYWGSQTLFTANRLGLFDLLGDRPGLVIGLIVLGVVVWRRLRKRAQASRAEAEATASDAEADGT